MELNLILCSNKISVNRRVRRHLIRCQNVGCQFVESLKIIDIASSYLVSMCPRRHGLAFRAVACEARGPGFDSSSDQMVFLLNLGIGSWKNNESRHDKLDDLRDPCRYKREINA